MGWILLFGPWNSSRGYRQTVSPWNRPGRWGSGRVGGRLHVTELRSSAIENGPVVSGFPAPVILASFCTLLNPLATLSLNPKHALIGTPEVQVSIVFLSKEVSVFFSSGNKFRAWFLLSFSKCENSSFKNCSSCSWKYNCVFFPLHLCYREFGHRTTFSLDFFEKWIGLEKLPIGSSVA